MRANAVRQIAAGVDRTSRLTNQLLDLAALETSDEIEAPAYEPVCQLLVAVSTDMRMLAVQRGISIELPDNMPLVQLPSPHLFTLAARNLIENAVNHSPRDGAVRCQIEAEAGKVRLTVEDNGPGIPDSEMPHVTERFFRGAHRNETGSGLGLAIVKMAAERMGGELQLQNRSQGGLSASIIVPGTIVE